MPPADTNAPATAPTPVPEPPKKQGFFAKLFGGSKQSAPVVPANFESQTPTPRLDDAPAVEQVAPATVTPAASMEVPGAVDTAPVDSVSTPTDQSASVPSEPVSPVPPAPTQPVEPMPAPSDPTPPAGPVPPVQ